MRRVFVYSFMRPDDFAWAPITFPGVQYDGDGDGVLGDGMQARGTAHLISAIGQQGYELAFEDQATDQQAVMNHILWDKWTEDEIGEHRFVGRLFNERGQIYCGCTAFDAANYTLQRLAAFGGGMRSLAGALTPLPWWAQPPEAAGPLMEAIERLRESHRGHAWDAVNRILQEMASANSVDSILQRQENTMDAMLASLKPPSTTALLPDFPADDYDSLEASVLALIPTTPGQLADIEQAVKTAHADRENPELLARITQRLPDRTQLAHLTPWAVFVLVSLATLKVAPEINPNDIGVLAMILMVVLYLLRPGSWWKPGR